MTPRRCRATAALQALLLLVLSCGSRGSRVAPARRKLSEELPHRLIVGFSVSQDGAAVRPKAEELHRQLEAVPGVAAVEPLGNTKHSMALVTAVQPTDLGKLEAIIGELKSVAFVEVDHVVQASQANASATTAGDSVATSLARAMIEHRLDDPGFTLQWGLGAIDMGVGWRGTTGSRAVLVCVVDTGIDYEHEDLRDNVWTNPGEIPGNGRDDDGNGYIDDVHGYDFHNRDADPMDDHSHGTHIAGVIGAVARNGKGIVGVAHEVSLMACKTMNHQLEGYVSDSIRCVQYCHDNGADIMTFSWGSYDYNVGLHSAIDQAEEAGRLIVASAGNSQNDNDRRPYYPACYPNMNVISVASVGPDNRLSSWSSYGRNCVDIAAPGERIYSTMPGNSYGLKWGTSQAVPYVAGIATLLKAWYPNINPAGVKLILLDSAERVPSLLGKCVSDGALNASAALRLADQIAWTSFTEYLHGRDPSLRGP